MTMRHPQIVVFELDGLLARALEPIAQARGWMLRESQQGPACMELLRGEGPVVLAQKLGRNLVRELKFLNDVHTAMPDVPATWSFVALLCLGTPLGPSDSPELERRDWQAREPLADRLFDR